ncbi:MAG: NAD(P)-dependent alcohol dehydrogenase [Anaerolineae bacterium]|nr:NAD(P)-dependent alcohol dehydrogenase [Anaerolineae bacterium]
MKAIVSTRYGSPDVLQLQEVAKPTPKDNEILVRVHAGVVTPSDTAFRKGDPFIIKLLYGLTRPRLSIGGVELAGEVEAVGKDVKQFTVGDAVFGVSPNTFGAHAEYVCLREDLPLVTKPVGMTYDEAVTIMDGSPTALIFLRDVAKLQPGQHILINGAAGAVGSAAVQLAKYYGATVTGVCSTRNIELVKSSGADHVIDYSREDFTKRRQAYDVIFDAVGKSSFGHCKGALTRKGVYMTTVPSLGIVFQMLRSAIIGSRKAKFTTAGLIQNKDNFNFLKALFEAGDLRAVIDHRYPLEQAAEAHRYVDTERKRGSVVITVRA